MNVTLRMNGVGNAFLRELGCDCPQCSMEKPRANTSASIIVHEDNKIIYHALFDCGSGTVDGLIRNNISKVDCIFNTHNHLDHISDLDRLVNSLKRNSQNFKPIPFYCTQGTWDSGLDSLYPWLKGNLIHGNFNRELWQNDPIILIENIKFKVTPIPVYHGRSANEPVVFVIEFCLDRPYKIILCWDYLHLVKNYSKKSKYDANYENENPEEIVNPEKKNVDILNGATELFLAGNTRTHQHTTGHASIMAGFELIKAITPERTWFVHYSGHEDKDGPLTDNQLQDWINKEKVNFQLEERPIFVAHHGMEIEF
jgi:ribonuclease BN (tRNA processing enzyme)